MDTLTIIWLVLAIVMATVEAVTVQLVSIWFACGAAAACIASMITDNLVIQIAVFVAVSAIALLITRPLVKKMRQKAPEATNADRYIGKTAIVLQSIDNDKAQGLVLVDNQKWTARSSDGKPVPQDASVRVIAIEGVKLIVEPTEK